MTDQPEDLRAWATEYLWSQSDFLDGRLAVGTEVVLVEDNVRSLLSSSLSEVVFQPGQPAIVFGSLPNRGEVRWYLLAVETEDETYYVPASEAWFEAV